MVRFQSVSWRQDGQQEVRDFNDDISDKQDVESASNTSLQAGRVQADDEAAKLEWLRTDPRSPRNWPAWRKWWIIAGLLFYTWVVFINLNGFVTTDAEDKYGVGGQVSIIAVSMYILGLAWGPTLLAPLSEVYGRQPIYIGGIFVFSILQIPTALSPTFAGVCIARFLTGCVAGIPISNVGASAADMFDGSKTTWAIMLFSFMSQVGGPEVGPVYGSAIFISTKTLDWFYWSGLIGGLLSFAWALTFGETLHDKVYAKYTGRKQEKSVREVVGTELLRSFSLLVREPIVTAVALTTTFLFGMLFIYLEGYPFIYSDGYGFNDVVEGAMFLPAVGGGLLAVATQPLQDWMYDRAKRRNNNMAVPEARLYTACFAVFALLASIFWFAFTSTNPKTVSYQVPMWSGFLFGYAEVAIYTGLWQYCTDSYGSHAGSALAAANLPANTISAGLAHCSVVMFDSMGAKWALATLGFITIGFLFVPPLLIYCGSALRKRSQFAQVTTRRQSTIDGIQWIQ